MKQTLLLAWKNAKRETTVMTLNALAVGINVAAVAINGPSYMSILNGAAAGMSSAIAVYYYEEIKHKINNAPSPN